MNISITKVQDNVSPSLRGIMNAISQQGRRRLLYYTGLEFLKMTKMDFGSSGPYRGKQWPQYSTKYAKKHGSTPTEVRSGKLRDSIQLGPPRGNWIEIFTTNPAAATQFFGSSSRRKNIPARNPFPMEHQGLTYARPSFAADKQLVVTIGKQLSILSSGYLPYQSSAIVRSTYQYGNPLISPQN